MGELSAALLAFVGTHFLMSHPLRAPMAKALGTARFQSAYTVVSLATFAWVYFAFVDAPRGENLWMVSETLWSASSVIMLFASILFAGSIVGNPALPNPNAATLAAAPARGVLAITRHPMMWSFALWAAAHALVAPYGASLLLTGGMAFLAVAGSAGQDVKKAALMSDGWRDWASRTSFFPFGNQLAGKVSWSTTIPSLTVVLAGAVLWLAASWLHPAQGAPVVGVWRWIG